MRTEEEIRAKIKELEDEDDAHLYYYEVRMINLLYWVLGENKK